MKTTNKSHICQSCKKRFTVDFTKNEEHKKIKCPYCWFFNVIKAKKSK